MDRVGRKPCQPSDVWQRWSGEIIRVRDVLQMLCGMGTGLEGRPESSNRASCGHTHSVFIRPALFRGGEMWSAAGPLLCWERSTLGGTTEPGLVWYRVPSQQLQRDPHEIWKPPLRLSMFLTFSVPIGFMCNSVGRK